MTRAELIQQLRAEGFAVVPMEPTVEMIEAAFSRGLRVMPSYVRDTVDQWKPNAGARHRQEPGLVSAVRAAIRAGGIEE